MSRIVEYKHISDRDEDSVTLANCTLSVQERRQGGDRLKRSTANQNKE